MRSSLLIEILNFLTFFLKKAFSNLGIVGRYILSPEIFGFIKKTKPGVKGEVQITDALRNLIDKNNILAYEFEGERFDTGDKYGYVLSIFNYIIRYNVFPGIKKELKKLLR